MTTHSEEASDGGIQIAGMPIGPGERRDLFPVASESYTGDRTTLPMAVLNGAEPGPRVFVTAALHGDELNGTAACQEVLALLDPAHIRGVLIVVPIANVLGAQVHSRYLPDRRDLNRSFPGTFGGSMASRLARLLIDEVVAGSDVGIDLHTAASRRTNVPQLRVSTTNRRALDLALAFGAPYVLHAELRPGSLREVAGAMGVPVLTLEGGEILRFESEPVAVARDGILRVLHHLGMIDEAPAAAAKPLVMYRSRWLRAERGGILDLLVTPGAEVSTGDELWTTTSPLGAERATVTAELAGIVIGTTTLPLVSPGDAVLHLGLLGEDQPPGEDDPSDEEHAP